MPVRTILATALALAAFAGNSLLCRLALAGGRIDAASFTVLRLASGALALALLVGLRARSLAPLRRPAGDWRAAAALFLYAAPFSFAYLSLGAGPGALILFAAVQLTMLARALQQGTRFSARTWSGLALALLGLLGLTLPGAHAPAPLGALLMAVAGLAWGFYSLHGRAARDPLGETAGNFLRALPFVLVLTPSFLRGGAHAGAAGVGLALASGALTSGLGYALWYAALPALSVTRAAVLQLCVPVLAAAGAVLLLDEPVTLRLLVAGPLILAGVALASIARR